MEQRRPHAETVLGVDVLLDAAATSLSVPALWVPEAEAWKPLGGSGL